MRLRAFCVAVAAAGLASLVLHRASADTIGPLNTVGATTSISINGNDPFQPSEAAWLIGTTPPHAVRLQSLGWLLAQET